VLDYCITGFYNADSDEQISKQVLRSSSSSDRRGGYFMPVKKKPGTKAAKSKPKLKSTMAKKKATKKPVKKK
jgi:hypothetical protein